MEQFATPTLQVLRQQCARSSGCRNIAAHRCKDRAVFATIAGQPSTIDVAGRLTAVGPTKLGYDSAGRVTVRGLLTGVAYYASFNADGFRREAFDNIPCPSYCQSGQGTAITFQPVDVAENLKKGPGEK